MDDDKDLRKKTFPFFIFKSKSARDVGGLFLFSLAVYLWAGIFDIMKIVVVFSDTHQGLRIDELLIVLACMPFALVVFFLKRERETNKTTAYFREALDESQYQTRMLSQEIAERKLSEAKLIDLQNELQASNRGLEEAVIQANALAIKVEISNHELTREIENRIRIEKALRESEETYRLITDNATDMIWTSDLLGRLTFVSPSVTHLLGYSREELMLMRIDDILTEVSLAMAKKIISEEFNRIIQGDDNQPKSLATQVELRRKDGTTVWSEVHTRFIADSHRTIIGILGVTRDITERKKADQKLLYMANHDALTGLLNRKAFIESLEVEIEKARRQGYPLALFFFDLDKFKHVNDSYGHEMGDKLLVAVAGRLKAAVRASDLVARIGGDEFTVLLKNPDDIFRAQIAARMVAHLSRPFRLDEHIIDFVFASMGQALYPEDGQTAQDLIRSADLAMYEVKKGAMHYIGRAAP
jgi:diguanylate cyclase (GGDEF)-like protein/PAS domain S-box-containing protein